MTNGGTVCTLTYNAASQLLGESYSGGPLDGLTVSNSYDALLRRTNLSVFNGATRLTLATYAYDDASRLQTVSDGVNNATYSYLANSPLVSQIIFKSNTTVRLTTTKSYDYLNRLSSISSQPSAAGLAPVSYAYTYNDANQRTRTTLADGSYWVYTYDALGQVTGGNRYWSDGTPVAGQQFDYTFDDIRKHAVGFDQERTVSSCGRLPQSRGALRRAHRAGKISSDAARGVFRVRAPKHHGGQNHGERRSEIKSN